MEGFKHADIEFFARLEKLNNLGVFQIHFNDVFAQFVQKLYNNHWTEIAQQKWVRKVF